MIGQSNEYIQKVGQSKIKWVKDDRLGASTQVTNWALDSLDPTYSSNRDGA